MIDVFHQPKERVILLFVCPNFVLFKYLNCHSNFNYQVLLTSIAMQWVQREQWNIFALLRDSLYKSLFFFGINQRKFHNLHQPLLVFYFPFFSRRERERDCVSIQSYIIIIFTLANNLQIQIILFCYYVSRCYSWTAD